jgi:hypothetical protein
VVNFFFEKNRNAFVPAKNIQRAAGGTKRNGGSEAANHPVRLDYISADSRTF